MRILLTNDDGIHAPGLERARSDRRANSPTTCSSSRRRPTSRASPIRCRSAIRCACARSARATSRSRARRPTASSWAVRTIMADKPPDLVLSGVNRGQNVAEDVTYSGTIAGAMEGAMLGVPVDRAVAGLWRRAGRATIEWDATETHAAPLIRKILAAGIAPGGLINVNFPALPGRRGRGRRIHPPGPAQHRTHAGRGAARRARLSLLLAHVPARRHPSRRTARTSRRWRRAKISITPLRLDLTDDESRLRLEKAFAPR